MSTPVVLSLGLVVYVLSCVRAWHTITKTEERTKPSSETPPRRSGV
jgi:hypothetical protein